jgi:hypothetical protein
MHNEAFMNVFLSDFKMFKKIYNYKDTDFDTYNYDNNKKELKLGGTVIKHTETPNFQGLWRKYLMKPTTGTKIKDYFNEDARKFVEKLVPKGVVNITGRLPVDRSEISTLIDNYHNSSMLDTYRNNINIGQHAKPANPAFSSPLPDKYVKIQNTLKRNWKNVQKIPEITYNKTKNVEKMERSLRDDTHLVSADEKKKRKSTFQTHQAKIKELKEELKRKKLNK